jgi:hypothetical protein
MTGSYEFPRFQVIPQVGRASLCWGGVERVAYEYGPGCARPFLFPLVGASGAYLTRMGHPDPVRDSHQKSVWFGHENVAGINFWDDRPGTDIRIRHRRARLYHDACDCGGLMAELDWWAHGKAVLLQELTIAIEPFRDGGFALDLQSRLDSPDGAPIELGPSGSGLVGVQVAKTLSEEFGGGRLMAADGSRGADRIMGKPARWVDYTGPSAPGVVEGICFMDHPSNPNHPARWHVGRAGLMSPSFNPESPYGVARGHSLELRYRLLVHAGRLERDDLERAWAEFAPVRAYAVWVPPHAPAGLRRGEALS